MIHNFSSIGANPPPKTDFEEIAVTAPGAAACNETIAILLPVLLLQLYGVSETILLLLLLLHTYGVSEFVLR